jgi:hypothetical protein
MTPLVGALAWSILAAPRTGFLNQLWHTVGGSGDLFNAYSPEAGDPNSPTRAAVIAIRGGPWAD